VVTVVDPVEFDEDAEELVAVFAVVDPVEPDPVPVVELRPVEPLPDVCGPRLVAFAVQPPRVVATLSSVTAKKTLKSGAKRKHRRMAAC
jgi:hypothetical protein